ncbi:MAG TPA: hypothetical protein VKK81_05090 [Candidatus Binatia bacterium]|nr:hypothetical protein [Candidatus Binatia bacterium]
MKVSYVIPIVLFALGIGLLIFGTAQSEQVVLLGLAFHPRIAKGLGIIVMIFSVITLLVAYGTSLPPSRVGRSK